MIDFDQNYLLPRSSLLAVILSPAVRAELTRPGLLMLSGKSLLTWSLESAMQAGSVREIVVVTQDPETARAAARLCRGPKPVRILELESNLTELQTLNLANAGREQAPLNVAALGVCAPLRESWDIDAAALGFEQRRAQLNPGSPLCMLSASHLLREQAMDSMRWVLRDSTFNRRLDSLRAGVAQKVSRFGCQPAEAEGLELVSISSALTIYSPDALCQARNAEQMAYILPEERGIEIESLRDLRRAQAVLGLRNRTSVFAPPLVEVH